MSNVLIGIIGVILFIGLALAGALFLGPRFQAASIESKAAMSLQGMTQLAQAMTLMQVDDGKPYDASLSLLPVSNPTGSPVARGYLKSLPKGGVNPIYDPFVVDKDSTRTGAPKFAVITLSDYTNEVGTAVCLNIVKRTGQDPAATTVPIGTAVPDVSAGCIRITGSASSLNSGNYYVFARM